MMNAAQLLHWLEGNEPQRKAVFGFDAFIDQIAHGMSGLGDGPIVSMTSFGERLVTREERSGTVFLNELEEFVGGNAPNTALTLSSLGGDVTCICALGYPRIKDVFLPLQDQCCLITYANPGTCLAAEFSQSKLFFSHNGEMGNMTWEEIVARVGKDRMVAEYAQADLIGLFNWGELPSTQEIWMGLLKDILPVLPSRSRVFFFDFSDVSARSQSDVDEMKELLKQFRQFGTVYASANELETRLLDASSLLQREAVDAFVTHGKRSSAILWRDHNFMIPSHFVASPKRLTGGGDSFNAGFCYGLLCGLPEKNCLMIANATAKCFVRSGKVPDKVLLQQELAQYTTLRD